MTAVISDKTILVTGAGGWIGSALAKSLVASEPRRLILLDHSERNLHQLHTELAAMRGRVALLTGGRVQIGSTAGLKLLRAGALISGGTLRLDLQPSDLDHPNHMLALEWVLGRSASSREAVTYEQLASGASNSPRPLVVLGYPPE